MSEFDTISLKTQIGSKDMKVKRFFILIFTFVVLLNYSIFSQTNNVGIGCTDPDASAILELRSTTMGFLAPRMTLAQRPATPVTGLLIYQTDNNPGFYYYNGAAWISIGFGTGLAGQVSFWGTANSLSGSNNLFWDNTNSRLGIGTATPVQSLDIYNGNLLLSNNALAGELMFQMPAGAFLTTFKAQAQTANINYTLPAAQGTSGQVLTNDGTGVLSWASSGAVPVGTSGMTLRYDATNALVSNLNIFNDGTNTGIGFTTAPTLTQTLEVNGNVLLTNSGVASQLMLAVPGGVFYTSFKSQAQVANVAYTLPAADGTSGQALVTNGTGILNWATISGSLPPGTSGQTLRYDPTNTLVANSLLFNDGTNIGIGTVAPTQLLDVNGNVLLSNTGIAAQLRFGEPSAGGTNFTAFQAQTQAADVVYTLPAADGTAGQALVTDGTGNLSWSSIAGSLPAGTSGQTLRYDATNTLIANNMIFNTGTLVGIGTVAPANTLHVYNNNITNQTPVVSIEQAGTGDASQHYVLTGVQNATVGLNNIDNKNFEISNAATLSANGAYTNVNKMMRIHTEAGSEGIVDFNHQSRVRAYLNVIQTPIPTTAWTAINFDTEDFDEKSEFATSTFTAKTTGYYQVNARTEFTFPNAIADNAYISIRIHYGPVGLPRNSEGNNLAVKGTTGGSEHTSNNAPVVSDIIYLLAGETITIEVYQNTGSDQTIIAGQSKTYVSIHKAS